MVQRGWVNYRLCSSGLNFSVEFGFQPLKEMKATMQDESYKPDQCMFGVNEAGEKYFSVKLTFFGLALLF